MQGVGVDDGRAGTSEIRTLRQGGKGNIQLGLERVAVAIGVFINAQHARAVRHDHQMLGAI